MKKVVLAVIILLLSVIFVFKTVSAAYICSNGSEFSTDIKEINKLGIKNINGIKIAVIETYGTAEGGGAELIINAEKILLANSTNSTQIEEISGNDYAVRLVNSTSTKATIDIGGASGKINEGDYAVIKNLQVFLIEAGDSTAQSADLIVGSKRISLLKYENSSQIATINDKEYLIELLSGSGTVATIRVGKCNTGEIEETRENTTSGSNMTQGNVSESNITAGNNTENNMTQGNISEEKITRGNITEELNDTNEEEKIEKPAYKKLWFWLPSIILAAIIAIYFLYRRIRRY